MRAIPQAPTRDGDGSRPNPEIVVYDTSGRDARRFAEESRLARLGREALFKRLSLDAITLHTDKPYLPALTSFLTSSG